MENISPTALLHFHGLAFQGLDTFSSKFVVVCKNYYYTFYEQKLKLSPSTLKYATLHYFMSVEVRNITTWAQLKQSFNKKYRDYYWLKETKEDIFRMTLAPNKSLEDYEERF